MTLNEIKAAAEAATEGPWYTEKGNPDAEGFPTRARVAATSRNQGIYAEAKKGTFPYNDQKFIAQARTAVPALCEALAEAKRTLKSWSVAYPTLNPESAFARIDKLLEGE